MTPTQLSQMLAIIDAGSLSGAARRLHISEPALSKRLKELERELGVTLMDRTARGVSPTLFGNCLAHHARIIRGDFQRAFDDIAVLKGGSQGRLAVGFSPSFGPTLVADALGALYRHSPAVQISTYEGFVSDLVPRLTRGEIDLAVITLDQHLSAQDLTQVRLGRQPAVLVARPGHPLTRRRKLVGADLAAASWLLARSGDRIRAFLEQRFSELGLPPPVAAIEFDSMAIARRMLAEHDLLAFLPLAVLRDDIDAGRLAQIAVPELKWERPVGIVHRRVALSPLALRMIDELKLAAKR